MAFVNLAGWDRGLRFLVAAILLYLGWGGVVTGGLGTFLKFFGFVPILIGLIGWCPAYWPFGFSTKKADPSKR
jgi:hypothetical protein